MTMKCNQKNGDTGETCPNDAAFCYMWPGSEVGEICLQHAPWMLEVAQGLGFELELTPIETVPRDLHYHATPFGPTGPPMVGPEGHHKHLLTSPTGMSQSGPVEPGEKRSWVYRGHTLAAHPGTSLWRVSIDVGDVCLLITAHVFSSAVSALDYAAGWLDCRTNKRVGDPQ